MIINCGNRRLVSYGFGWKIEILKTKEKTGEKYWREDVNPYPANLGHACESLYDRLLQEGGEIDISELAKHAHNAAQQVRRYLEMARKAA